MKGRFIAGVLVIALWLTGCGVPETAAEVTTSATTAAAAFEMTTTAETTTATTKAVTIMTTTSQPTETIAETTEKPEPPTFVDEVFEWIKTKNVNELKYRMGYCEGEDGWLYNVTFENFEIVEELETQRGIYGYIINVKVSESSDPRFSVGESLYYLKYNTGMYGVDNFTRIDDNGDYRKQLHEDYDITASDRAVMLAYGFEHAFGIFGDIPDMSKLKGLGRGAFEFIPIIMGISDTTELNQEYVNTWYNRFLGITEQPYDLMESFMPDIYEHYPNMYVMELTWKPWDNAGYGWRLDEQTDNTITITYFGDRCYLTPAKTIKYTYEVNDGIPRLLSSELVEDFGYEPYMMDFY
jgi:hypothetical protein